MDIGVIKAKRLHFKKTFERRGLKGLSLHLIVLDPVETATFDFNFENVPLP